MIACKEYIVDSYFAIFIYDKNKVDGIGSFGIFRFAYSNLYISKALVYKKLFDGSDGGYFKSFSNPGYSAFFNIELFTEVVGFCFGNSFEFKVGKDRPVGYVNFDGKIAAF